MASEPTLSSIALLAASASQAQAPTDLDMQGEDAPQKTKEQLRRHYIRALHKVVDESDIIVLVLDARDPDGCRSRLVEEEVRRREHEGKRLVFVLNKIGAFLFSPLYRPCASFSRPINDESCRSCSTRECRDVAPAPAAFYSHAPLSLPTWHTEDESVLAHRAGLDASAQGVPPERVARCHRWRGWIPERWEEQPDQCAQARKGEFDSI